VPPPLADAPPLGPDWLPPDAPVAPPLWLCPPELPRPPLVSPPELALPPVLSPPFSSLAPHAPSEKVSATAKPEGRKSRKCRQARNINLTLSEQRRPLRVWVRLRPYSPNTIINWQLTRS